jgi:hypothetical protein
MWPYAERPVLDGKDCGDQVAPPSVDARMTALSDPFTAPVAPTIQQCVESAHEIENMCPVDMPELDGYAWDIQGAARVPAMAGGADG